MHSKYWIWVSEGKKSKSWKWPAPFFQEGLAQTGLFQSFRTELLLYDERTLSLKYNHAENAWSPLPSGVRSFSWLCTKKPPSFSVWRWDELPNILRGFLLGSAYTGSLLSLSWGQPSISSFEHWGDTLLPWVPAPFPQLCSQSCSFYRPDRNGIQHIHWSRKRLHSIALDGLDGESIKTSYTTGCPSLFRLLQQNTSGWCLRNSRNSPLMAGFWRRPSSDCWLTLAVSSQGGRGGRPWVSLRKLVPFMKTGPPSSQRPHFLIPSHGGGGGIGISTYEFVGVGRRGTRIFRAQRWKVEEKEF